MNDTRESVERWIAAGERLLRELKESPDGDEGLGVEAVLRIDLARQRKRLACLQQGENCTDKADVG